MYTLICPICKGDYLHHRDVTVFNRHEDSSLVYETEIGERTSVKCVKSDTSRNPSSRRDGIAISFICEECPSKLEMTIAQHKGQTHIEWKNESKNLEVFAWKGSRAFIR